MNTQVNMKLFARYTFRETLGLVVMGVALFWAAGRVDWWPGWAVLGVTGLWIIATALVILRLHPALLAERLGPRKGAKPWDTAILGTLGLTQLARYIVAGLEARYGWTEGFSLAAQLIALVVCAIGYALFVWAIAANAYFSQIVRIQTERGQMVATSGPYQYVRHPSYIGAILFELASPILLDSWWTFIPSLIGALLLIIRTALEDKTLQSELTGYSDYAQRVRYRLLPGLW